MTRTTRPLEGIMVDAAHSEKHQKTEYQGVCIETREKIFYKDLGYQTVNIGEFLALVHAIKWVIENNYKINAIYSDSQTAISWVKNKRTASKKKNNEIRKAEIFLQVFADEVDNIQIQHWNNNTWGENPADFGNK